MLFRYDLGNWGLGLKSNYNAEQGSSNTLQQGTCQDPANLTAEIVTKSKEFWGFWRDKSKIEEP